MRKKSKSTRKLRSLHFSSSLSSFSKNKILVGVLILFLLLVGWLTLNSIQTQQLLRSKAGSNTLRLYIQPSAVSVTQNTTLQIWATAGNPVAFITTKILFDPAILQLTSEITPTSPLTRIIRKTAVTDANRTGVIDFSIALDPAMRGSPPSGTFQLLAMTMSSKTSTKNVITTVQLHTPALQAVNSDTSLFTISTQNSVLTLNPTSSATPLPATSTTPRPSNSLLPSTSLLPSSSLISSPSLAPGETPLENPMDEAAQAGGQILFPTPTPNTDVTTGLSWWQIFIVWIVNLFQSILK